jgi:hypothetical protein
MRRYRTAPISWSESLQPFLRWLRGEPPGDDPALEEVHRRFRRIARTLSRSALSADGDVTLATLLDHSGSDLFLGLYTAQGLAYAFDRFGITEALAERGLVDLVIDVNRPDPFRHQVRVSCHGRRDPRCRVAEIILRIEPRKAIEVGADARGLCIEWILLQNPHAGFPPSRPPLPGQQHPGLGLGREVLGLLALLCERLDLDGLWSVPKYFHNAALYSVRFHFADPTAEGRFLAMRRDTRDRSLHEVSWAIAHGALLELPHGRPVAWPPGLQVYPRSELLRAHFERDAYREARDGACAASRFVIDWTR